MTSEPDARLFVPDETDAAIAQAMSDLLIQAAAVTGFGAARVLLNAHAQIVAMMAANCGGSMTTRVCTAAAEVTKDVPDPPSMALALARPQGSA